MLHADIAASGADRFVERVVGPGGAEFLAIALPETADRGVIEQDLADRAQHRFGFGAGRALGQRVKAADALDRVAKKIEPQRLGSAGRIKIDDAAAHREFAGLAHRVGAEIAVVAKKALQPVAADPPPGRRVSTRPSNSRRGGTRWTSALTVVSTMSGAGAARGSARCPPLSRSSAVRGSVRRGGARRGAARPAVAPGCATASRVKVSIRRLTMLAVWRHPVIGQAIPGRKRQRLNFGMKKRECRGKPCHSPVVAAYMQPMLGPLLAPTSRPTTAASWPSGAPYRVVARGRAFSERTSSSTSHCSLKVSAGPPPFRGEREGPSPRGSAQSADRGQATGWESEVGDCVRRRHSPQPSPKGGEGRCERLIPPMPRRETRAAICITS